jgi:hypothetical protein
MEIKTDLLDISNLEIIKLMKTYTKLSEQIKFKNLLLYSLSSLIILMFSEILFWFFH